ncbi:MAG: YggS family pyridoxal phosphate-dependent enzyme [Desulfopila sp.]
MSITDNIQSVLADIATIAAGCGRSADDIQLVAVSKRFPISAIEEAIRAGHRVFGENYIQEAQAKIETIGGQGRFHFIGHLQSNKAKIAARLFDVVETVDSLKLARALSKHLQELQRTMRVLLQVNIGEDERKSGATAAAAEHLLCDIQLLPNIEVVGLMTMPPFTSNPEEARPYFRNLRQLAERLAAKGLFRQNQKIELSMGMSHDYHVAIQEGATIVRVGTAIFGQRQTVPPQK